jgi:transposase
MRGADVTQEGLFIVKKTADYVPADHPLIAIREIVNTALREMDRLFESMYEERGRYSVPPEWLLRGLIVQALYGIRSERLLCEQLGYNMLFRWFVGLGMEDGAWDHSTYTQNRDRLIDHDAIRTLFGKVMQQAEEANLLSSEHFSVDGTLIRAWASIKSFVPKDGPPPDKGGSKSNPEVDFKGQKRSNATHVSTSDPDFAALHQVEEGRGVALLHGPRADGQPQWAGSRYAAHPGQRQGGVPRGAGHAGSTAWHAAQDGGRRQSLRYRGVRQRLSHAQRHAPCRAKHLRIRHQDR